MTRYLGIISDPVTKRSELIKGDFKWKPHTETIGDPFGTVCHWFTDPDEMLDHIEYLNKRLGFRLDNPQEIPEMVRFATNNTGVNNRVRGIHNSVPVRSYKRNGKKIKKHFRSPPKRR